MVKKAERKTKCVVWDLDNTVWMGTLLEDSRVVLREGIVEIIKTLDSRGILQSIASKNEYKMAMEKLEEFGISQYFLYPQINWQPKSSSMKKIAEKINIGMDTIAFIDDQLFEREEVRHSLPDILCLDVSVLAELLDMPEMNPRFITEDSKTRRLMYLSDMERDQQEESFTGNKEDFLATLNMVFTISTVKEGDLQRAEELTVRTHQLNTTGYTYSYEELNDFRKSKNHRLFIASLEDKFGTYGKIGLALVECRPEEWIIKLLLMSCRVMSRGVGTIMLNFIMGLAKEANVHLKAEFVMTDRNRMMYITYKFAGFKEIEEDGNLFVLENNLERIQSVPEYIRLKVVE